jgi:hypothetical protein
MQQVDRSLETLDKVPGSRTPTARGEQHQWQAAGLRRGHEWGAAVPCREAGAGTAVQQQTGSAQLPGRGRLYQRRSPAGGSGGLRRAQREHGVGVCA